MNIGKKRRKNNREPWAWSADVIRRRMAEIMNGPAEDIQEVVIVISRICPGCGLPHLMTVASTTDLPETIIALLSHAITDVIDEYDLTDDVPGTPIIYGEDNEH